MTTPNENRTPLFQGLPRRRGAAALALVALWLGLAVAFLIEVAPIRPPEDRLHELEAQRDFYVRAAAARRTAMVAADAERPARVGPGSGRALHGRTPSLRGVLSSDNAAGILARPPACGAAQ